MYETFFELSQRPFAPHPLTSRYFASSAIESARTTLVRCVERAEGAALVVGTSGTGKTLLCYLLAEHFRQQFAQAMLFSGHLSSRQDLLRAILFELGLPYRGLDEGELRLSLIDFLTRSEEGRAGLLLVIDEAHTLPLRLLEEVRTITNVVRNGQPQVRLVLAGGPALEEHFASPKLESFSQRLAARCYLEPLDRQETLDYIRCQLRAVAAEPSRIFGDTALEAVYRATDGIPRLINQVCDHALVLAKTAGRRVLHAPEIETAWADLQQLPTPWNEPAAQSGPPSMVNVVEFGDLEEEFFAPGPELRLAMPPSEIHDDDATAAEASSEYENSDEQDAITVTEGRLDQLTEQWDLLESDFLGAAETGLPEVELVFDEAPAVEDQPHGDPLIALSYTNAAAELRLDELASSAMEAMEMEADEPLSLELPVAPAPAAPSNEIAARSNELEDQPWQPIEEAVDRTLFAAEAPRIALSGEVAPVIYNETTDEVVVVDRYATLDELKRKGILHRGFAGQQVQQNDAAQPHDAAPQDADSITSTHAADCAVAPTASTVPAADLELPTDSVCEMPPTVPPQPHAGFHAEKNLTLAEALVRHATAVEQTTIEPPPLPDSMFSVLSMPASADGEPQDAVRSPLPASADPSAPLEYLETCASSSHPCPEAELGSYGELGEYECEPSSETSHVVALQEPAWQPVEPMANDNTVRANTIQANKVQAHAVQPEQDAQDELELIVVEDDPQTVVIPTAPQVKPVRRQEYRQLFARLRKS